MTDKATAYLLPVHELAATCGTASELSSHVWFEGRVPAPSTSNRTAAARTIVPRSCYMCKKKAFGRRHGFYVSMCARCGVVAYQKLKQGIFASPLAGYHALVVGGRTKIGYQVALRLLRAGARVTCTTRFVDRCVFHKEPDWATWRDRLRLETLELNQPAEDVRAAAAGLAASLGSLDGLFVVAAQTIRGIERRDGMVDKVGENRYGDAKHFHGASNSWALRLEAVTPVEMEEVMRVNVTSPFVLIQVLIPLLLASGHARRCIVNVHAREGMFSVPKSSGHPHTNVAKAGLHMITHMVQVTYGARIPCYGIDPGWISVDEYGSDGVPLEGRLPLTELDGAARITDPVLSKVKVLIKRGTIRNFVYGDKPEF